MVDASVIKKTQESLGKIIKKPPLTEKLLSKPPFRYLHDIISEVNKQSGFLDGLYNDKEATAAGIKDKDAKIAYLQKTIDAVGLVLGSPLAVRPTKIIAGAEPEKTNEFLQYLGRCAAKGANQEVVQRVMKGEKPVKKSEKGPKGKGKDPSKDKSKSKDKRSKEGREASKSKERDSSKGRGKREQSSSKERVSASSKERTSAGKAERPGRERKDRREDRKDSKEKRKDKSEEGREKDERRERRRKDKEEPASSQPEIDSAAQPQPEQDGPAAPPPDEDKPLTNGFHETEGEELPPARIPRPSSAKGTRRRPKDEGDRDAEVKTYAEVVASATTSDGPVVPIVAGKRRERPTSARPAPPRIKKKEDEEEEMMITARQGSGRPPAGIIVDNSNDQNDDDEMFVNEETEDSLPMPQPRQPVIMDSGQHGGLVQKIIDSQKQYSSSDGKEKEDKAPMMNQAARQKERAIVKKEIDQLRVGIQTLASSAAPLGKVLDYMQEDLDSMQKELETWKSENKYHETAIKAEESHMDKTLEPLKEQLEDVDRHILDMINKINAMKCNIHNNDTKIEQMLSTMSFTPS